jgi:ABC-type Zn2+ transport system substrate-binding protein/surface adhesin
MFKNFLLKQNSLLRGFRILSYNNLFKTNNVKFFGSHSGAHEKGHNEHAEESEDHGHDHGHHGPEPDYHEKEYDRVSYNRKLGKDEREPYYI